MGLFEGLEKLLNEHGSAAILKERISLANDKYSALEARVQSLSSENEALCIENNQFRKQIRDLEEKLARSETNSYLFKYGIYWDSTGNPFCPRCRLPVSNIVWTTHINCQIKSFKCPCSDSPIVLFSAGEPIHAPDAMKEMANA
ncbi:MAG: hypothetical protein HUU46_05025 [Candidatus Hydrogenedentes bacterium]|nr:hypothetical protein [Candidatus Hydrogenedentota bacterium]